MEISPEQQAAVEQQKQNCPFCQIVSGSIPAQKVYEDEEFLGILDINPAQKGHILFLPKEHYPIMPLIPEETFNKLFLRVREITKYLREAMLTPHTSVFIANGQAAGQQASHFLLHIIPEEKIPEYFRPPVNELLEEEYNKTLSMLQHNLPLMLKKYAGSFQQPDLATIITQNPDLREAIINNPEQVQQEIQNNPELQKLFSGVDLQALGQQLQGITTEQQPTPTTEEQPGTVIPQAKNLSDEELRSFINNKETLKQLLHEDQETLQIAIAEQPRLQHFFEGTTPEEVLRRYQEEPKRRYE